METKDPCPYCTKGKPLSSMHFGDVRIKTYIESGWLYTDAVDHAYDEEDSTAIKITHCPVCGAEVHELPDEDDECEEDN